MSEDWTHVVFVARSSAGKKDQTEPFLRSSLEHTKRCYERTYGQLNGEVGFLTFIQRSNLPLPSSGHVIRTLDEAIAKVKAGGGKLLVVINGWDGLTTNVGSFNRLFNADSAQIAIRVFAEVPRQFFHVNVAQVIDIFMGKIVIDPSLEPTDEDNEDDENNAVDVGLRDELNAEEQRLESSTAQFYRMFMSVFASKADLSAAKVRLDAQSGHRNTDPAVQQMRYTCPVPGCRRAFPLQKLLHAHSRQHNPEQVEQRTCPHCRKTFTRKDSLTRHLETCGNRPGVLKEQRRKKPFAKRGTLEIQVPQGLPALSDLAPPTYMELTPAQVRQLPRIEINSAVLEARSALANKTCDVIYRGELYCRYLECENTRRFAKPGKLRRHYEDSHKYTFPAWSTILPTSAQKEHTAGILWLTKWALGEKENAGQQPFPLLR
ncbi:uncharacterized protein N7473_013019 [Penicillium subrubescens]|jgi:hypothetical protein|uniref:C2H2-type domain-containing protein n=1 Tax=Penicillium subrubescens TaxID=1316194 RepID=A0A1Q5T6U7_9EURO|nr:uncharacterized protein N7473_013019 [Penicillium subrubescens]KAJ5875672.1 hypothetical protein N7473_013019 [Penicillium subrubescens]OKO95977.1 hypothetical protein PENSUB_10998 [Penicillium subrubescens]